MPSEAELCRELHVSRVTLRRAIEQLVHTNWITPGGRGRHHRIRKKTQKSRSAQGTIIRALSPYSLSDMGSVHHVMIDTMIELLGSSNYRFEYEHRPAMYARHSPDELKRMCSLPDTAAWILYYSTPAMQRWFAGNEFPCMVIGRPHEDSELPCIFPDLAAAGRHAAGLFYQRGHREMVYLIAEFTSINDRLTSKEFVQEAQRLGANAQILTHDRDPLALTRKLETLLASRPRPTAFFSTCPEHCLTTLCYLLSSKLRVPADASVISGWEDEFLHYAHPQFAYYRVDGAKFGNRAAMLLLDVIQHGATRRAMPILPEFMPGGTLGRVE